MANSPLSFVVAVYSRLVARSTAFACAPGTAAPPGSTTCPVMLPVRIWPCATQTANERTNKNRIVPEIAERVRSTATPPHQFSVLLPPGLRRACDHHSHALHSGRIFNAKIRRTLSHFLLRSKKET